jgi:glycosyltransferase involved in cell wall biosynthesis
MDWIVFADDWGRHPSTTQHLVANLPDSDRILWFDSLAMRPPRLAWRDVQRIRERLVAALGTRPQSTAATTDTSPGRRKPDAIIHPVILPWHAHPGARLLNRAWMRPELKRGTRLAGLRSPHPVVLIANPVAALYAPLIDSRNVIYLRLDDWPNFEGADPAIVSRSEPELIRCADLVVAPNTHLLEGVSTRSSVLAQGVDLDLFDAVPLTPPHTRTLGFWGSISQWLDLSLVAEVARLRPDWTLELLGRVDTSVAALDGISNIRIRPPVPHHALGAAAAHWSAAWAPFKTAQHVPHSSPLKLREYLAAGLPAASTPLDEAASLPGLTLVKTAADAIHWLDHEVLDDDATRRATRRESVANASWKSRADELRRLVSTLPPRRW